MSGSKNTINIRYYESLWSMDAADYLLAKFRRLKSSDVGKVAQDTRASFGQVVVDFCRSSSRIMKFLDVTRDQFPNIQKGSIPEPVIERFEELIAITRDHSNSCLRS